MVKTTTTDGLIDWMGGLTTRQGQGLGQRFDVMRSGRAATTKPPEAPHTRHAPPGGRPAARPWREAHHAPARAPALRPLTRAGNRADIAGAVDFDRFSQAPQKHRGDTPNPF